MFISEPVGRLIRRSKVEVKDGVTYLKNAHPGSEFIRSTDPNFRAMHMQTGPDGCLYIVDMYRGIIQQGNWTKKGSYLRGVIDEYGFAKNIQRGRIYRLVHEDFKPGPQPKLLDASSAELVKHLAHPNGWWRDNAQKILILRGDKSVTTALESMAASHKFDLARMRALWTLEGLGALKADFVRKSLKDEHPSVRRAAIRVSETLIKNGDPSLQADILALAGDSDPEVATQVLLTAKLLKFPDFLILAGETPQRTDSAGVLAFAQQLMSESKGAPPKFSTEQLAQYKKGQNIYKSLCFSCHGADGKGTPIPGTKDLLAPSLVGSKIINGHPELGPKVVLHGLTGPIDGKTYAGDMIAMASNGDAFIADVLSYIRNSFGNDGGFINERDVKRIRQENSDRKTPWTMETLIASVPQVMPNRKDWKLSASDGTDDVNRVCDGKLDTRWSTGCSMKPGMWFQIELPEKTQVAGLILNAAKSKNDYPRGCQIEFSDNGEEWSKPLKLKERRSSLLNIDFKPRDAKFIRITQTGKHKLFWSIHDLHVLQAP